MTATLATKGGRGKISSIPGRGGFCVGRRYKFKKIMDLGSRDRLVGHGLASAKFIWEFATKKDSTSVEEL